MQISLSELADHLGAELRGDGNQQITGVATLKEASSGEIAFLANESYRKQLASVLLRRSLISASERATRG